MMNNKLIPYKKKFFTKISNFFKKFFSKKKEDIEEADNVKSIYNIKQKDDFIDNISIKEDVEEKRLKELQLQYDNREIDEEDISDEDMDKLIEMYEKEIEKLNVDTEKRKNHIAQMLKELRLS